MDAAVDVSRETIADAFPIRTIADVFPIRMIAIAGPVQCQRHGIMTDADAIIIRHLRETISPDLEEMKPADVRNHSSSSGAGQFNK